MDLTLILSIFGSVTGALSLVGLMVAVGMYKERIDRHERWFNLLVEESLMRAWKSGKVDRQSPFRATPELVSSLPAEVKAVCLRVAGCCRSPTSRAVADRLVAELDEEVLDRFCVASGLTPLEAIGGLTTYTLELMIS